MPAPCLRSVLSRLLAGSALRLLAGARRLLQAEPPPEPVRAVKVMTVGVEHLRSRATSSRARCGRASSPGWAFAWPARSRSARPKLGQHVKAGEVLAQLDPAGLPAGRRRGPGAGRRGLHQPRPGRRRLQALPRLRDQNFISGAELERRETTLQGRAGAARAGPGAAGVAGQPGALHRPGGRRVRRGHRGRGRAGPGGDRRHAGRAHRPGRRRATWCSRCPKTRSRPIKPGSAVAVRVWADGGAAARRQGARSGGQRRPGDPHLFRQGVPGRGRSAAAGRHGLCVAAGA